MTRLTIAALIALLACPTIAWAQDTGGTEPVDQTPGAWIAAARVRHQMLQQARVTNPRVGEFAGTTDGLEGGSGSFTSSTGGLSDLLGLLTSFSGALGGGSSSLGGLTDLLGGLTGGGATSPEMGGTTPAAGGETSGPQFTIEDLLQLRDEMSGGSGQTAPGGTSKEQARSQQYETRVGSGAIGRLPKIEPRAQEQTQQRKFVDRFAERMATTVFAALTVGFQSQDFIAFLKDQLRPVFFPSSDSGDASGSTGGDSTGSDGGSGDGGGIENQQPPGGSSDGGSGSIV